MIVRELERSAIRIVPDLIMMERDTVLTQYTIPYWSLQYLNQCKDVNNCLYSLSKPLNYKDRNNNLLGSRRCHTLTFIVYICSIAPYSSRRFWGNLGPKGLGRGGVCAMYLKGLFTNFEYITFFSCPTERNIFYERFISIKPL